MNENSQEAFSLIHGPSNCREQEMERQELLFKSRVTEYL